MGAEHSEEREESGRSYCNFSFYFWLIIENMLKHCLLHCAFIYIHSRNKEFLKFLIILVGFFRVVASQKLGKTFIQKDLI